MVIVSGTQRSGTSMWMQILLAGGFQVVGKQFTSSWEKHFRSANPSGFYESVFRRGMKEKAPQFDSMAAVKIFPPGLALTPRDRINYVIATMRDVREFVSSKRRFWRMEDEANANRAQRFDNPPSTHTPIQPRPRQNPAFEWWHQNVVLLHDSLTRHYPIRWVAYDTTLVAPVDTVQKVFTWLNEGDAVMGAQAVKDDHRTQFADTQFAEFNTGIEGFPLGLCAEWYLRVRHEVPFSDDFVARVLIADSTLRAALQSKPPVPESRK
jgi:hypothetical protein